MPIGSEVSWLLNRYLSTSEAAHQHPTHQGSYHSQQAPPHISTQTKTTTTKTQTSWCDPSCAHVHAEYGMHTDMLHAGVFACAFVTVVCEFLKECQCCDCLSNASMQGPVAPHMYNQCILRGLMCEHRGALTVSAGW